MKYIKFRFRLFFKDITRFFTFWEKIDNPPRWVVKAGKPYLHLACRDDAPNNHGMIFKGKKYLYRVSFIRKGVGNVKCRYYRKRRIK